MQPDCELTWRGWANLGVEGVNIKLVTHTTEPTVHRCDYKVPHFYYYMC